MIGVSFPSDRKVEVKAEADANGLTMSSWARMTLLNKLDEVKRERKRNERAV
jgi:hypothetical protein